MAGLIKRYIILIVILAITSGIVGFLNYDTFYKADAAVKAIKSIPAEIGKWHGHDVPLDKRVYGILETKAIINRNYVSNGHSVFLSLVYYPDTKVDFHAPEACLSGRGTEISKTPATIYIKYQGKKIRLNVNRLVRSSQGAEEVFFYFYKAGSFVGRSYIKLRLNLAVNKFRSNTRSGSLIRVSTPVIGSDYESAEEVMTDFIQDMYPYLIRYL